MLRILSIVLLLFCGFGITSSSGQGLDLSDALGLDSARIEGSWDTWSLRVFTSYKSLNFGLRNTSNDGRIRFTPNNRYSVGVGITYKFISADIGFAIKSQQANHTKRFDGSVTLALANNIFELSYQRYKGFNVTDEMGIEYPFRSDIRSQVLGIQYFRSQPYRRLSIKQLATGMYVQKKSTGMWYYGGSWFWDQMKGDSSVVPPARYDEFEGAASIELASQISLNAHGGYTYSLVLPYDLFIFGAAGPGLGVARTRGKGGEDNFLSVRPSASGVLRLAMGYTGAKMYVVLSANYTASVTGWGEGRQYYYTRGRIKFAVGYRFTSEIGFLERMADGLRETARRASF